MLFFAFSVGELEQKSHPGTTATEITMNSVSTVEFLSRFLGMVYYLWKESKNQSIHVEIFLHIRSNLEKLCIGQISFKLSYIFPC